MRIEKNGFFVLDIYATTSAEDKQWMFWVVMTNLFSDALRKVMKTVSL